MSNFINRIKSIKHLEFSKGATKEEVRDAEKTLQLKFYKDYSDYLNVFGCISFFGTEWTGLNGADYLNVVDVTAECYIVEFGMNRGVRVPVLKSEIAYVKEPNLSNKVEEPVEEEKTGLFGRKKKAKEETKAEDANAVDASTETKEN